MILPAYHVVDSIVFDSRALVRPNGTHFVNKGKHVRVTFPSRFGIRPPFLFERVKVVIIKIAEESSTTDLESAPVKVPPWTIVHGKTQFFRDTLPLFQHVIQFMRPV